VILEESHALLLLGPEPGCVDLRNPLGAEVIPDGGLEDLIALVHAPLEAVADGSHVSHSVAASLARKSHRCAGPPLSPLPIPPVPFVQLLLASATTDTGCPTEDPRVLDRDPHVGRFRSPTPLCLELPVVVRQRVCAPRQPLECKACAASTRPSDSSVRIHQVHKARLQLHCGLREALDSQPTRPSHSATARLHEPLDFNIHVLDSLEHALLVDVESATDERVDVRVALRKANRSRRNLPRRCVCR